MDLTLMRCPPGGETPISDGSWTLQRLKAEAPDFVSELQKKVKLPGILKGDSLSDVTPLTA